MEHNLRFTQTSSGIYEAFDFLSDCDAYIAFEPGCADAIIFDWKLYSRPKAQSFLTAFLTSRLEKNRKQNAKWLFDYAGGHYQISLAQLGTCLEDFPIIHVLPAATTLNRAIGDFDVTPFEFFSFLRTG